MSVVRGRDGDGGIQKHKKKGNIIGKEETNDESIIYKALQQEGEMGMEEYRNTIKEKYYRESITYKEIKIYKCLQ